MGDHLVGHSLVASDGEHVAADAHARAECDYDGSVTVTDAFGCAADVSDTPTDAVNPAPSRKRGNVMRFRIAVSVLLGACLTWAAPAQTAAAWQSGTYVYDGGGNIKSTGTIEQCRYDAQGQLVDTPEKRRVFHPDHLGTPRLITGNGGAQIGPAPSGSTTSGGGTQATANQPIPVNPTEVKPLDSSLWQRVVNFFTPK